MKKTLSVLMTVFLLLSLGAAAFASEEPAAADLGGGLGTELENAGIGVGAASGEAGGSASKEPAAEIAGPNGEIVTLTVNGVQTDILPGRAYDGSAVLTLTDEDYLYGPNMGSACGYFLRAAEYYENGALVPSKSVTAAVGAGKSIVSAGKNFNGVMITGDDGSVTDVSGYDIDLTGWGENDMGGVGAGVYAVGNGITANISDTVIRTRGATRTAVFTGGDSTVNLDNVHVYTYSGELPPGTGDLNNMEVPWMLGLIGTCRATNALGGTATTWNDSSIVAYDWGALSTDSLGSAYDAGSKLGNSVRLTTNNTYIATLYSGYGAYADGGAVDRFYNSAFDVADIAVIMTGTGEGTFDGTYVNAGSNAVMVHAGGGGVINAVNSEFHVGGTAFLIKDSKMTVNIENSTFAFDGTVRFDRSVAAKYGVQTTDPIFDYTTYSRALYNDLTAANIVKVQHNADAGSGSDAAQQPVVVNVSNSTLEGDFLNTSADVLTVTTFMMGNAVTRDRPSRSLELNVSGSEITGAISLGKDKWDSNELVTVSGGVNDFQFASATELGYYTDGEHGLSLSLSGSTWNVTRTSYLSKLTVDAASAVNGLMTVDGVLTDIVPGSYEGVIVVIPAA